MLNAHLVYLFYSYKSIRFLCLSNESRGRLFKRPLELMLIVIYISLSKFMYTIIDQLRNLFRYCFRAWSVRFQIIVWCFGCPASGSSSTCDIKVMLIFDFNLCKSQWTQLNVKLYKLHTPATSSSNWWTET